MIAVYRLIILCVLHKHVTRNDGRQKGAAKRCFIFNRRAVIKMVVVVVVLEGAINGKEGNVLFNDALNTFYLRL